MRPSTHFYTYGLGWQLRDYLGRKVIMHTGSLDGMRTRVVLDDNGLSYNRLHIPWEAMTGLRAKDYSRKYWVDLEYTAGDVTRSLRLDSFHIQQFNEVLAAICERKGFPSPVEASGPKEDTGGGGPPPPPSNHAPVWVEVPGDATIYGGASYHSSQGPSMQTPRTS
jgi:hypothetical protein